MSAAHSRSSSTLQLVVLVLILLVGQADGLSKGKRSKKDKDKDSSNLLLQLNKKNVKNYVSSAVLPAALLLCSPGGANEPLECFEIDGCAGQVDVGTPGIVTVVDVDSPGIQVSLAQEFAREHQP